MATACRAPALTSRSSAKTAIRAMPLGNAAARQASVISKAGVVIGICSMRIFAGRPRMSTGTQARRRSRTYRTSPATRAGSRQQPPSFAYARRGGTRSPHRTSPATGTKSTPARPTRPADGRRRSAQRRRRTGSRPRRRPGSRQQSQRSQPSHLSSAPNHARFAATAIASLAVTQACPQPFRGSPRPRRRICSSTRCKNRRSEAYRGTAPGRAC